MKSQQSGKKGPDMTTDAENFPKMLQISEGTWAEIGNMLDFWEQLSNDTRGMIEEESEELVRALDAIASSNEFAAEK